MEEKGLLVERLPPIVDIGPERQLFFDDVLIEGMERVGRSVNQPARHPDNPILAAEHSWECQRILYAAAVIFDPDEGRYGCWYSTYDLAEQQSALLYARSDDGVHFERSELDLVEYDGRCNNRLSPRPLRFSGRNLSINADAAGGNLQVETLTLYGAPIPGFTRATA